jgi:hypothetical protein
MLRWFAYEHLPAHLQEHSRPFALLARDAVARYKPSAERSTVLRKLLEAKDAAVRCALESASS